MTLTELRYVVAVARERHFGRAAEACFVSQPTLSVAVKKLEEELGLAIFDHPTNPRHPTWWHVRDYGLFAANPFGIHDFEKKEKGAGDLTIEPGGSITFKYRFYIHEGDEKQGKVSEAYERYVRGGKN